jgi:hypothetical protein
MTSSATWKQADSRIQAPTFWGMTGWKRAMRMDFTTFQAFPWLAAPSRSIVAAAGPVKEHLPTVPVWRLLSKNRRRTGFR